MEQEKNTAIKEGIFFRDEALKTEELRTKLNEMEGRDRALVKQGDDEQARAAHTEPTETAGNTENCQSRTTASAATTTEAPIEGLPVLTCARNTAIAMTANEAH